MCGKAPPLANTPASGSQQATQLSPRAAPPAECRNRKSITEVKPSNLWGAHQNEGNYERGCTFKHFRVPTPLSTWQNAPLPKNTEFRSSKQAVQLSPRAALHALCFTSTYLSKYVSFSCKSMCIDIYRRQLRWSSPSVNWSVIRMQFFLQAQSSVCKPSD